MTRLRTFSAQPAMRLALQLALQLALIAVLAAACTDPVASPPVQETSWSVACVNSEMTRVDDSLCPEIDDDDDDGFFPYFYPAGLHAHPVGHKVSGGHRTKPAGIKVIIVRAPAQGGLPKPGQQPVHQPARPGQPGQPGQPGPAQPAVPAQPARPGGAIVPGRPANPPAPVNPGGRRRP